MAITEDTANQPSPVHSTGTSATTAAFTPPGSRLLVALVAVDGNSGSATTVTMSDTASGTWTLRKRQNSSVSGLGGSAEVWIRDVSTSPGSITVTASWAGGGGAVGGNLTVRTLIGAAVVASQTGTTAGNSATPGTIAVSVTPTQTGSRIYGAALDYTNSSALTANANTTSIDQFNDTGNGDTWAVLKGAADTSSLSAVSYGYTTSASFNIAAVELLPASGSTPISVSDTGSSTEAVTVTATVPLADTGSTAEALTASVTTSLADTGSGADALAASASVALADTGSAADTLAATASVPLTDAGSSAESLSATAAVPLADAGSGVDSVTVNTGSNPTLTDTASAADSLAVLVTAALSDAASALEALGATVTLNLPDSGSAADGATGSDASAAAKALTDAGSGVDHLCVAVVRPNTGVTARPNTGTVARPSTGTVARPSTGTVTRPNTGIVSRP